MRSHSRIKNLVKFRFRNGILLYAFSFFIGAHSTYALTATCEGADLEKLISGCGYDYNHGEFKPLPLNVLSWRYLITFENIQSSSWSITISPHSGFPPDKVTAQVVARNKDTISAVHTFPNGGVWFLTLFLRERILYVSQHGLLSQFEDQQARGQVFHSECLFTE